LQAAENETGSFDTAYSTMSWANASIVNNNTIMMLNYNDTLDEAYLHLGIEVPVNEPSGVKTTFIIFNWISN